MADRATKRLALVVLVAVLTVGAPRPFDVTGAQQATIVTVSQSAGPPDSKVTVPVYFTPAAGVAVGRLVLDVKVPSALLTFQGAELSGLSEGLGVTADVSQKAGPDDGSTIVHIVLAAQAQGSSREPLPDGPLVHLAFVVAASVKPGTVIPLEPTATAQTFDDPPRAVEPLVVPPGEIVVSEPGISSCFFYMH